MRRIAVAMLCTMLLAAVGSGPAQAGTITGVTAGSGLQGGGTNGNVTLSASFGGDGSSAQVCHSDHTHLGDEWTAENPKRRDNNGWLRPGDPGDEARRLYLCCRKPEKNHVFANSDGFVSPRPCGNATRLPRAGLPGEATAGDDHPGPAKNRWQ